MAKRNFKRFGRNEAQFYGKDRLLCVAKVDGHAVDIADGDVWNLVNGVRKLYPRNNQVCEDIIRQVMNVFEGKNLTQADLDTIEAEARKALYRLHCSRIACPHCRECRPT